MEKSTDRNVNVAVQVLPMVDLPYPIVDQAIRAIEKAGVRYEVGPMETVMEGPLDELMEAAKAAHLACFDAGAEEVVTIIKIGDRLGGTSVEEKVAKYRSNK